MSTEERLTRIERKQDKILRLLGTHSITAPPDEWIEVSDFKKRQDKTTGQIKYLRETQPQLFKPKKPGLKSYVINLTAYKALYSK